MTRKRVIEGAAGTGSAGFVTAARLAAAAILALSGICLYLLKR